MRLIQLLFLSAFSVAVWGQAGNLDTGFGTTGVVSTSFGIANSEAFASAIQPDGKIVTGGNYTTGGNAKIAFVRYQSNGTLDATFGTNGRVQINTASGASVVRVVALLSNGSILGAGTLAGKPMLVRLTSAGVADATFGTNGIVEFDGGLSGITDMKVDGTGKIVGCGRLTSNPNALVVFRRNTDGTADNTFNMTGFLQVAQVPAGGGQATPSRIAFQNGKILITGFFFDGSKFKSVTARVNTNGTVDNTFGSGGRFVTAFGNTNEYGDNMVVQPDNKIVFCGRIQVGSGVQTLVYRITENGALDTGFGTNGKYNFAAGGTADECTALAVQTDGKILIGGNTLMASKQAFIVRLSKTGQKDTGFGTSGQTNLSAGSNLSGFALQNDAKIVAAGYSTTGTAINFSTFRFNAGAVVGNDDIASILASSSVYPNPVSATASSFQYKVQLDASDRAQAAIYGLDGKLVYQFNAVLDLQNGENIQTLELPTLPQGQYLLRVVGGQFTDTKTLMVW
jgi:uncharacterized delta-60 repeat protein